MLVPPEQLAAAERARALTFTGPSVRETAGAVYHVFMGFGASVPLPSGALWIVISASLPKPLGFDGG